MSNHRLLIISILLLTTLLAGCSFLESSKDSEIECDCCTDGLFESDPIQDLLDGDNEWMGLTLGVTKANEIEAIFDDIPHELCYWKWDDDGHHKICNNIPEEYFSNIGGYIYVFLTDFNCQGFQISWELDKIDEISFWCEDCLTVDQFFSQIGEPIFIEAWPTGLHETKLATFLYYPMRGLKISVNIEDRLDPQLTETTTITYFSLSQPQEDNRKTTLRHWIGDTFFECVRKWIGYGDIVELYYAEEHITNCP